MLPLYIYCRDIQLKFIEVQLINFHPRKRSEMYCQFKRKEGRKEGRVEKRTRLGQGRK